MDGTVQAILRSLVIWGPLIAFAGMFLDCLPFAAFVAPGVILLVLVGYFAAGRSLTEAVTLFISASGGVVACDTLMYAIGRAGYSRSARTRAFIDKHERLRREILAERPALLVFYQFPPYSRMFAPLVMGALEVSWRRWAVIVSFSTVVFVGAFFVLGYAAGSSGKTASGATETASVLSTVFLAAFLIWLIALVLRLVRAARQARGGLPG
jgi:membrane protein DedA with SNARE-associated domain